MGKDLKVTTGKLVVKEAKPLEYTDDELAYRGYLIHRIQDARDKRNQPYTEFNDMTYQEYWLSNAKAANSYIRPKKNKQDTRVVTGTTEEKGNTIMAAALNNNFQPNVLAFDRDDLPLVETGQVMEKMIKKSRILENPDYDESRIAIYKEFFDQGTVFVEERFLEMRIPQKKLNTLNWSSMADIKNISWTTKWKTTNECQSNLITGLNVYLGSMKELYMERQPYVFTREVISRRAAQAIYGRWERWKHVPFGSNIQTLFDSDDLVKAYNNYATEDLGGGSGDQDQLIEVIKYQDKWNNEYMILLNGVMMLPVRFPLSGLLGVSEYTIAKGDAFPISRNFAYSKSIPAKTKVEQQVFDEILKLMVLKTQQSFNPAMINNTGQVLSRNVMFPGTFTENIDPNKLKPVVDPSGVSSSEFNFASFIKSIIDQKSISPVLEGQSQSGEQTAREIIELKQQSLKKLGLPILGLINLEKKMSWLRLVNVLQNWVSPIDKRPSQTKKELVDIFRSITVNGELDDGASGQTIIEMSKGKLPAPEQVMAEEEILTRKTGVKTRKIYLNPKQLTSIAHKWFITIVPTPKEEGELRRAMFNESLQFLMSIFGPEQLNMDHIKQRWATLNQEDADKLFLKQNNQQASLVGGQQGGQASNITQQLTKGVKPQRQQPSINTLVNG